MEDSLQETLEERCNRVCVYVCVLWRMRRNQKRNSKGLYEFSNSDRWYTILNESLRTTGGGLIFEVPPPGNQTKQLPVKRSRYCHRSCLLYVLFTRDLLCYFLTFSTTYLLYCLQTCKNRCDYKRKKERKRERGLDLWPIWWSTAELFTRKNEGLTMSYIINDIEKRHVPLL